VREWLARAARAPRDRAWVADGVIADSWAPIGPRGTLDAFVWRTPEERLIDPPPLDLATAAPPAPPPALPPKVTPALPKASPNARAATMLPASAPDDPGPERRKAGEFRDIVMD
jgi:HemY protein